MTTKRLLCVLGVGLGYVALVCVLGQIFCHMACSAPPDFCVRVFVDDKGGMPECDSQGSGTLISPTEIITNYHVVRDRKKNQVMIMFPDWSWVYGKVVREDEIWDVAVIEIDKTEHTPAVMGKTPKVGEPLTIHGYGFGIPASLVGMLSDVMPSPTKAKSQVGLRFVDKAGARFGDSGGPVTYFGMYVGTLVATNGIDTLYITVERVNKIRKVDDGNVSIPKEESEREVDSSVGGAVPPSRSQSSNRIHGWVKPRRTYEESSVQHSRSLHFPYWYSSDPCAE